MEVRPAGMGAQDEAGGGYPSSSVTGNGLSSLAVSL